LSLRAYRKLEKSKQNSLEIESKKKEEKTLNSSPIQRNSFNILGNMEEDENNKICISEEDEFEDEKEENEEVQIKKRKKKNFVSIKINKIEESRLLVNSSSLPHFSINCFFIYGNTEFGFFKEFIATTLKKLQKIGIDLKGDDVQMA
jgi:hypothetical protein